MQLDVMDPSRRPPGTHWSINPTPRPDRNALSLPVRQQKARRKALQANCPSNSGSGSSKSSSSSSSPDPLSSTPGSLSPTARLSRKNRQLVWLHRKRQISLASSVSFDDVSSFTTEPICCICWQAGCRLKTHRQYQSRQVEPRPTKPIDDDQDHVVPFTKTTSSSSVDPSVNLPTVDADPEMHLFFRDFFTNQSTSLIDVVRVRSFDAEYLPVLACQAIADPALCHTYIAMAATYSTMHDQGLRSPDARLLSIYGRTFRVLREQMTRSEGGRPSENTLMAAVNLLMCHVVGFGDPQALLVHSLSLANLITACGGVTSLSGQVAARALWSDLNVTLYTGNRPMFIDQVGILPEIPLSSAPPREYGSGFGRLMDNGTISPLLLEICNTTCRLTELLEDRIRSKGTPAKWEYFHYRRNSIPMRNAVVHAEHFRAGTKAECISLANNIILFLYLRLMPWVQPIINLSNQLRTALVSTGLHDFWTEDIDVLIWILFVILAVEGWDGKDWAVRLLLDALSHHHRCKKTSWPPNWREMQRLNLMRYAWSNLYLTTSLKMACRDLGIMYRAQAEKIE